MKGLLGVLSIPLLLVLASFGVTGGDPKAGADKTFAVHPIGYIEQADGRTLIVLDKKYQSGLLGLDGFSHIQVIWWFDKNDTPQKRAILQVHP